MKHQLSDHQMWTQALLAMVYTPMVAYKVGRYPLEKILRGLSLPDRAKVIQGIQALVEMKILVLEQGDICITNISEGVYQGLDNLSLGSVEEVAKSLGESPKFAALLSSIDNDPRLSAPGSLKP